MEVITSQQPKVHLISLGCARNRVDSEVMLGAMLKKGWAITDMPEEADAVVVNTCGFIQSAKEESIDTILQAAELKKDKPDMKLVVTGCLTQRYKTQLSKGMPEVDFFVGTDEFPRITEFLANPPQRGSVIAKRTNYLYSGELPKKNTLTKTSAYVKVAEGCQHNCAFCIIPAIRGRLRSRPIENVVKEVETLARDGVLEINLIAQDLAAYGRDFADYDQQNLLTLLKALVKIEGIQWIRPLYVYPENISDEFIEFFASEPKLVKYIDIPVQHASDAVLMRMNRDVTKAELRRRIQELRQRVPGIAIRTSVMVGFPGETAEEFAELRAFVEEMRFDHLGCFSYSQEEGTVAGRMPDQIDEAVKTARLDEVMKLQQEISRELQEAKLGQKFPVLVIGQSQETELLFEGRLMTQAPEVDGVVYVNDGDIKPGTIQLVEITDAFEYDLVGRIASFDA